MIDGLYLNTLKEKLIQQSCQEYFFFTPDITGRYNSTYGRMS